MTAWVLKAEKFVHFSMVLFHIILLLYFRRAFVRVCLRVDFQCGIIFTCVRAYVRKIYIRKYNRAKYTKGRS